MWVTDTLEKIKVSGSAVALGYFDGIHMGHRAVLEKALSFAKENDLVPVVLLFDVHPRKLVSGNVPPMLMSEEKKRERLLQMGFAVADFDFRNGMNYTPEEFAEKVLLERLNAKAVSCGYDYRYGKGGAGNAKTLCEYLAPMGIRVFTQIPVLLGGEAVSSTRIRELVMAGEIRKANELLGDFFSYDLVVKHGDGVGHTLGFPTINQFFPEDFIVPRFGVYASRVKLSGRYYPAVTNVGTRPTVDGDSMRSETCIIGFSGDLYGKKVEVSLLGYIRGEVKFPSLDELKNQVEKDKITALRIYSEVIENG